MTTQKLCKCHYRTECIIKDCECLEPCKMYKEYDLKKSYYITVSPNPKDYMSIKLLIKDWISKIYKLSSQLEDFIFVFEMDGARPHIHGVAIPKEGRLYGLANTIYSWSRWHNSRIHKEFVKGFHYLFKQWKSSLPYLKGAPSILDPENIGRSYQNFTLTPTELLDDMLMKHDDLEQRKLNLLEDDGNVGVNEWGK